MIENLIKERKAEKVGKIKQRQYSNQRRLGIIKRSTRENNLVSEDYCIKVKEGKK
jgi:hypothetical protein